MKSNTTMIKTKINATIVADSIDPRGNRITTILGVIPRIILAELNTHRMFSRNSASSRAIPFKRMVEAVIIDPFIPIAWQVNLLLLHLLMILCVFVKLQKMNMEV